MKNDAHFDRPLVTSVARTESDRIPHVLVSQPSTDLRRTRSESQLLTKALDSISVSSSTSGCTEDEIISVCTLSSLGSEFAGEQTLPSFDDLIGQNDTLTPSILTPRAKDATLTPGMSLADVEKKAAVELESATPVELQPVSLRDNSAESMHPVASSQSLRTECEAEDDTCGLTRNRPTSTRKQRLHVALQASKRKVLDLVQKRRPTTPSSCVDNVEMGADAGDLDNAGVDLDRESPLPSLGKRSPVETQVIDKKEKRKKSKNGRSPSDQQGQSSLSLTDSPASSQSFANSRTTKTVQFRENVLWGQSLHYDLGVASSSSPSKTAFKYLNITVHAKESPSQSVGASGETSPVDVQSTPDTVAQHPKPILLGYTSLYVPQIIDDCQLTLSNCHREVFQLKPPTGIQTILESTSSEFSRHAGHDPRLCYGDITVGFRYFPGGLPLGSGLKTGEESDEEVRAEETLEATKQSNGSPALVKPTGLHEWKPWSSKSGSTICAMCRGKIWLKSASHCHRCLVVCHHKCVDKAASGIACIPPAISQRDGEFIELDIENEQQGECPSSIISAVPQTTQPPVPKSDDTELISRRVKLRNKMTEKFSSWRRGGKAAPKLDLDAAGNRDSHLSESSVGTGTTHGGTLLSPMASIQDCLADVLPTLEGSPFIRNLYFQPGNAYNEQTIANAKLLGKEIFSDLKGEERKSKINEQIDRIQLAIRETKDGRLAAMKKDSTENKASATFEGLDERLQALAVLMLHYCAALQDCESHDRDSPVGVVYDSEALPDTPLESHSFSRMMLKFREKITHHRASLRKQVTRSLHIFETADSPVANPDSLPDQLSSNVVEFQSTTPPSDRDEMGTSAPEELNQAFILVNEDPDPRAESY